MPLYLRKIVMWLFILTFLIITPLTILYTSGWRYNWKKGSVEQTGVLMIDVQPRSSKISVNNELLKQLFPFSEFHLDNLLPGEYNIKVEKENYHSWEKNVEVKENISSFINKVILFKNINPEIVNNLNITDAFSFENNNSILFTIRNNDYEELWAFNIEDEEESLLYRLINPEENINTFTKNKFQWSANNNLLLFNDSKHNLIFDLENSNKITDLNNINVSKIEKIHWSKTDNNIIYYIDEKNNLNEFNIDSQIDNILFNSIENEITDFLVSNDDLYYLSSDDEYVYFFRYNARDNENEIILHLALENYKLKQYSENSWLINNDRKSYSYFFQFISPKLYFQELNTNDLVYSSGNNKITYTNNNTFELFTFENFQSTENRGENFLLSRYSSLPKNLKWFKNNEYVFYSLDNEIKVIELDGRGNNRNIHDLHMNQSEIKTISLDINNENLYFLTSDGIYKLGLVD